MDKTLFAIVDAKTYRMYYFTVRGKTFSHLLPLEVLFEKQKKIILNY